MELIPITKREVAGKVVETINARDVWQFVESKQEFSPWVQARIKLLHLVEGVDFTIDKIINRKATQYDYVICVNHGKQLCQLEWNDRGTELRQWFIDRELRLQEIESGNRLILDINDPSSMLACVAAFSQRLMEKDGEIRRLGSVVEEQSPKVEALALLAENSIGSFCLTDAAKNLGTNRDKLIAWLDSNKWIYKRQGTSWIGFQERLKSGDLEHKFHSHQGTDCSEHITTQVRITVKGMARLAELLWKKPDVN